MQVKGQKRCRVAQSTQDAQRVFWYYIITLYDYQGMTLNNKLVFVCTRGGAQDSFGRDYIPTYTHLQPIPLSYTCGRLKYHSRKDFSYGGNTDYKHYLLRSPQYQNSWLQAWLWSRRKVSTTTIIAANGKGKHGLMKSPTQNTSPTPEYHIHNFETGLCSSRRVKDSGCYK